MRLFDSSLVLRNFIVHEFLPLSSQGTKLYFLGDGQPGAPVLNTLLKCSFLGRLVQATSLFIISESLPRPQAGASFAFRAPKKIVKNAFLGGDFMENVETFYPSCANVFLYPGFQNNPFINLYECVYVLVT